ncbi:carboxyesterase [Amycolatopsis mediterranei S699]|uniref:Carboxylic ester hydrolase n=2 Tax=Amycolatopsis mediterranei TaxID=33910 RepID=A0A0H3DJZ3_AMYMU|nr:carboxylesterase family protein [Amycolatopsis mediterranei]ADJ50532.1 putative carboxyesterase [Amycolatopsis mediterranei U32]AEK47538.1 carboxyesterase [Amycolatopsis mediterranei S699]AFO82239.1 carboxyesterase [Amycolatopsis mediterranei S699]AGT89368.1 carboxyesterase [Amycolatopsis mediterranei RB]KDO09283.1 carboxylesterase [Amycolatopsis mediterranei]
MIVETTTGRVRGTHGAFKGIPYATAKRFEAPKPPKPWSGVKDALEAGPAAPQPPSRLEHALGPMPLPQSEDCLFLNVFTPSTTGSRPVLVWIHGGGFSSGSGGQIWYTGTRLARDADAVVVTLNYRLGVLGFLSAEGIPPNLGIADQLAALEWVRDNIAGFGGNPAEITLGGQSAGAQSTLALWSSRRVNGLVKRIALQSAPLGMRPSTPDEATRKARMLQRELGEDIRTAPVARLIAAQLAVSGEPGSIEPPFQLVADDDLVATDLVEAAPTGPALISWTREELRAFVPDAPQDAIDEANGFFTSDRLAKKLGAFTYRFDWQAPGNRFGACHCIDIPFLFGTHDVWDAPMLEGAPKGLENETGLREVWAAFLHGERPSALTPPKLKPTLP